MLKNKCRAKLIKSSGPMDFEHQLNDFIKDKEVTDIQYSTTSPNSGVVVHSALIIYAEEKK